MASSVSPPDNPHADLDKQIGQLMKCQPLPEEAVKALCEKAKEILVQVRGGERLDGGGEGGAGD
jgi:hypothetical protein